MGIVDQYLVQLNNEKRRWRRAAAILAILSLFVAIGVSWNLRMTGITIANDATCGQEEHQHAQDCPAESLLICGYDAEAPADATAEASTEAAHVHTEDCYEITWLCGLEEHIHAISCYADTTADLESAVIWEATLPKLTENWAEDLVQLAQSQLGNGESARNYILAEDGETRNGITRYGQWYGNPHGDWSAMFALFCLHYAQIPQEAVPWSPGVYNMMRLAQDAQILLQPDENLATPGNLMLLDTDANGNADRIAIICGYEAAEGEEEAKVTAIAGDWENTVAQIAVPETDPGILGYLNIRDLQEAWETREEADPSEPTQETIPEETSTEPAIYLDVEFPEEGIMRLVAYTRNIEEAMYTWQWQVSEDGNEPWTDIEGATELTYELENTEENFNRYYRLQGRKMVMMYALRAAAETDDSSEEPEDDSTLISEPIAPFSIDRNNGTYTIDVFAIPVDAQGNRIQDIAVTNLGSFSIDRNSGRITAESRFNASLGVYQSAYFGSETQVGVNNIASVSVNRSGNFLNYRYTLRYRVTGSNTDVDYLTNAESEASLYLRYIPEFTVTFASEGFTSLSEQRLYGERPTLTEPGTWTREGYKLLGWVANGDEQHVYTFEEIMAMPVTENVTYTAQWAHEVTVSFNLGEDTEALNPIEPMVIPYGSTLSPLPTPTWKNNTVAMAFDGWYLDQNLTQPVPADYEFREDTTLYAKWSPKEEGYYVYFMDFQREGQVPLVLVTYSVTEGKTVAVYTPGNTPAGTVWDGNWYLSSDCTNAYNFSTPVSDMTEYLTGANGRDLYLYPGTQAVCRAIFVTYGTKVDPITVPVGGTVNLDLYSAERPGYTFAGWTLQDGTEVSGEQTLTETTTFYAKWEPAYVPFEAVLRLENANDTGMTQADILGTWYAKSGSQIRVNSTYTGEGNSRTGRHEVVCVVDGVEYPVYRDAALTQPVTLSDVYDTYFLYNNTGTNWTDEVNWDDVYTSGELPYSTRPISSAGDTIINFDYMRVRNDIVFTIPNNNGTGTGNSTAGGYIDVYKLQQNGLITGSVIYDGTKPTATGQNVSAHGVSAENISWTYTAAPIAGSGNNTYTLHNMKYGQRIFEVYPVGGSWLTARNENAPYHEYKRGADDAGNTANFSSRRQDLTADFFRGSGRGVYPCTLTAEFSQHEYIALMYAVECLADETPDFTVNGINYKVRSELCEVVKHTGYFGIKSLEGCEPGVNALGTYNSSNKYYTANSIPQAQRNYAVAIQNATFGGTSVNELFGETYWSEYAKFNGVTSLNTFAKIYLFYYDRLHMNIQFNFAYDSNGNGENETLEYTDIVYGERIGEYQFAMPDYERHPLLNREGYEFKGWMDSNGFVLAEENWESLVLTGDSEHNTMIFIAKWEKISNNVVEYYEDRSSTEPFEYHYFEDGDLVPYPTMTVYPAGWVWQEYGEGQYQRFDWDVPMYGEYGVQEVRTINGEEREVNVIRIYGTWDDSHTKVVYDPNAPQGGIPGSAPTDPNEYTIWQSEVPVAAQGDTANTDPNMVFVGWKLDKNGIVYQPGDHVPVQWPRTMTFQAQWAKQEEVVYLRYDPNGGTPVDRYPNDTGFPYQKNATAAVWDNMGEGNIAHFQRPGYKFIGWNTAPDGSGTDYPPDSSIVLTAPVTTLYAQWERTTYTLSVLKVDMESDAPLHDAVFNLYQQKDGTFVSVLSQPLPKTGTDGKIIFADLNLEVDTLYKLVEVTPPGGYAILSKETFFALRPDGNTVSLKFYDAAGKEISAPTGVSGQYISGDGHLALKVQNLRGYELPSTGGTGIFFHILCGLILMSAPLVYGISLRRKYERRSRE